jgi:outer membrane receptor protein involved in Fe transport
MSLTLALSGLPSPALSQQTGAIRGRVESSDTHEALVGVKVSVQGGDLTAVSGEDGEFRLGGVSSGATYLTFEFPPRFVTSIEQVRVRPGITVRALFEMEPMAVVLDELLVRGRPATSDALVKVFAPGEARERTGGGTVVDLLAASFSGIQVIRGSGQAGAGSRVLIRGTNSLQMAQDPLVFVDGFKVTDVLASEQSEAHYVISFLDLIPADAVSRIEVLKGPSATRFGIGSSNGVILIFTR